MMSSTETIFYTMSVYFMAAGIKKSRYTLVGALMVFAFFKYAKVFFDAKKEMDQQSETSDN